MVMRLLLCFYAAFPLLMCWNYPLALCPECRTGKCYRRRPFPPGRLGLNFLALVLCAHFQDAQATATLSHRAQTVYPVALIFRLLFLLEIYSKRNPSKAAYGVGCHRTATFGSEQPNTLCPILLWFRHRGAKHHLAPPRLSIHSHCPGGCGHFPLRHSSHCVSPIAAL